MTTEYDDAIRELRDWAVSLLDKVEPYLDEITDDAEHDEQRCTGCPWCRMLTSMKQDQPDAVHQLAGQARAAVAFLRANIETPVPTPAPGGDHAPKHLRV